MIIVLILAVASVQLPVSVVSYLTGSVMPLVTGFVTHVDAPGWVKAVMNLVLSGVAGVLAALLAHSGTLTVDQLVDALFKTYLASGVFYKVLWQPTNIAAKVQSTGLNVGAPTVAGHV